MSSSKSKSPARAHIKASARDGKTLALPVGAEDHVQGSADAPVTLVEYGDFECPYSSEAATVVADLRDAYGDRLRYVFRHFPLSELHEFAEISAQAAEAAGAQGEFWRMHDLLFENSNA